MIWTGGNRDLIGTVIENRHGVKLKKRKRGGEKRNCELTILGRSF